MQLVRESLYDDAYYFDVLNESILNEDFNIQGLKNTISKIKNKPAVLSKFVKRFNETKSFSIKKRLSIILTILFLFNFMGRNNTFADISRMSKKVAIEKEVDINKLAKISRESISKIPTINYIDYKNAKTSDEAKDFIKEHEKLRLTAYTIGDEHITIGYGHSYPKDNSPYSIGDEITQDKAERLFDADIIKAENGLKRLLSQWEEQDIHIKLDQSMFDSMISMIYNMGIGGFRQSEFVQHLKNGDYQNAAEKIKTTRVSSKFPGLMKRRQKEHELFTREMI